MNTNPTLGSYLDDLASAAPTPGGGSVAALVNALGCALGEMVSALSASAPADADLSQASARLHALRGASLAAMERDERAYAAYIAATRLPKSTAVGKAARRSAMQTALIAAAEAPLALARTSLATLGSLLPIANHGNKHVLSDAHIGAMLAGLAIRAALVNVRVNTALIKDPAAASRLNLEAEAVEQEATTRLGEVEKALGRRSSTAGAAQS